MEPVVGCASLGKGTILASGNISVPGGNRRFESPGVNAGDTGQLGERAATHQVSRFDNSGERQGRRLGVAEAVASNGTVIGDEECLGRHVGRAGPDHGLHKVMVAVRLVDKTPSGAGDRDNTGLATVDEMSERCLGAVRTRHQARSAPRRRHWDSLRPRGRPQPRRGGGRHRCWRGSNWTSARHPRHDGHRGGFGGRRPVKNRRRPGRRRAWQAPAGRPAASAQERRSRCRRHP